MIGQVLLAHAVGDYILQSDWMAQSKTKRSWPAVVHAVTYTIPFVLLTQSPAALTVIAVTHFVIDRWRLARYVVWLKNFVGPVRIRRNVAAAEEAQRRGYAPPKGPRYVVEVFNPPWSKCTLTGYPDDRPIWLTTWLLFIADNLLHVFINLGAIAWL